MRIETLLKAMAPSLLLAVSCGGGGSGSDLDAGTDTDTDTDTDADTDTDTDTDTGDGGTGDFRITSPAFADGDTLPVRYTCDGEGGGVSPPLEWAGVPAGTVELALLVTTLSVDGLKWNWVRYGIPGDATGLPEGGGGIGSDGLTSDGPLLQYYPPCPHGPGAKSYDFTLYALSEAPAFSVPAEEINGQIVTDAIAGITLGSCVITVTYTDDSVDAGG
jgi:phosphatidylethanolamine-binding protein (PEBP) family uncharacterized protein